jgi:hypothetical protein
MSDAYLELHNKIIETEIESIHSCRRAAAQVLNGSGVEFGAGDRPWPVPKEVDVKYFDDLKILDGYFPGEHNGVVDLNAKNITELGENSQDFVIGAHLFEHLEDPLGWLDQVFKVLKPSGYLLLAVPNKSRTFDIDRDITTFTHLDRDRLDGGKLSRFEHLFEHFTVLHPRKDFGGKTLSKEQLNEQIKLGMDNPDLNLHFHVFNLQSLESIIQKYIRQSKNYTLDLVIPIVNEIIILLRKQSIE